MEDADIPPTQPSGALVPPTKIPRTAVATATPEPPNRNVRRESRELTGFRGLVARALNVVDSLADNVAAGLGLR